ncbi:ribosomal protein S18-alanine N-acetyltransferase [Noviherbaspirillum sp.]|uniref:ribosomal protein S18-alanine N-acetyltransferase n=1 Tax=Noviherbaspirillum sp. TaxID=1926288 RepID=UPI002FE36022
MIANHEVGLAVPGDATGISLLSRNVIEQGLSWSWTPRRVANSIADRSTNVAVVRHEHRLAGFAIMKYAESEAHILLLAVHPDQRRKGVGLALLAWLEATARVAGIDLIRLEVRAGNAGAIAFYRQSGFREMHQRKRYYQGIEDALCMAKDLWLPS